MKMSSRTRPTLKCTERVHLVMRAVIIGSAPRRQLETGSLNGLIIDKEINRLGEHGGDVEHTVFFM